MSIKVLVADDSITIQKVIGIIFGGDEYSLTVVDNGKAAVEMAREINPDILLIDALMPGMNGYEVAEAVRATPALAAKPILLLTGSFEPFDEEKAKNCGADDFIAKPFESQQIISKVKELLELGTSRATAVHDVPAAEPEADSFTAAPPLEDSFTLPDNPSQQTDAAPPAATADIWGAFTPEAELDVAPAREPSASPVEAFTPAPAFEPDVFAIVSEEEDSLLVPGVEERINSPQHTGSQWVPVEENTFEFEEETIAEPPQTTFEENAAPDLASSFGDIAFEEAAETPAAEAFAPPAEEFFTAPEPEAPAPELTDFADSAPAFEPSELPSVPFEPLADPASAFTAPVEPAPASTVFVAPAGVSAAFTEDQLRAALASVSKDVIERIVWEIVPDLADALIRDAIRKIKEGV